MLPANLFRVQIALAILAVVLLLRGMGAGTVIGLALIPTIVALFIKDCRRSMRANLARMYEQLKVFSANPSERIPRRALFYFAFLPCFLISMINNRSLATYDSYPTNLTIVSLFQRGSFDFAPYIEEKAPRYFYWTTDKGSISAFPLGMVAFQLPVSTVAMLLGAKLHDGLTHWRIQKFTAAAVSSWIAAAFLLITCCMTSVPVALWTTALLIFGSGLASTLSQSLWTHTGVVACLMVLVLAEMRLRRYPQSRFNSFAQGAAMALMLACRLSALAIIVPFGLWLLLKDYRRAIKTAVLAVICFLPWAAIYYYLYGHPLGPQAVYKVPYAASPWGGVAGLLFSPGRGFFVYQPWAWLLLALPFVPRTRDVWTKPVRWETFAWMAVALQVFAVAMRQEWWAGFSWGTRYLVELTPLLLWLALPVIAALLLTKMGKRIFISVFALSVFMHFTRTYLNGGVWDHRHLAKGPAEEVLWSWSSPPFLFPFQDKGEAPEKSP